MLKGSLARKTGSVRYWREPYGCGLARRRLDPRRALWQHALFRGLVCILAPLGHAVLLGEHEHQVDGNSEEKGSK